MTYRVIDELFIAKIDRKTRISEYLVSKQEACSVNVHKVCLELSVESLTKLCLHQVGIVPFTFQLKSIHFPTLFYIMIQECILCIIFT